MAITQEQFIKQLQCKIKVFEEAIFFKQAVTDNLAKRSKRIFTDGKNSNNGQIGQYSKDDIWIPVNDDTKSPVQLQAKGKAGKRFSTSVNIKTRKESKKTTGAFFANGKERKSAYFPGYGAFRKAIGRQANFVNLNLFGNLKSNFENNSRGPIQVSKTEFIVGLDAENSLKKGGITEKYGEVFPSTKEEQTDFHKVVAQEFNLAIKNCTS